MPFADVNVMEPGRGGAKADETTESARMLHRRCQRAEAGHGEAMVHRDYGFDTNAASQILTC